MKLVLHTLIIFFGTLVAAGLVALGEPVEAGPPAAVGEVPVPSVADAR
ncbi:hypothetical protein [Ramlibacter sp. Leaf400]|nr:hypothetical protein [Ramlibacter sp. Leaf400]